MQGGEHTLHTKFGETAELVTVTDKCGISGFYVWVKILLTN